MAGLVSSWKRDSESINADPHISELGSINVVQNLEMCGTISYLGLVTESEVTVIQICVSKYYAYFIFQSVKNLKLLIN